MREEFYDGITDQEVIDAILSVPDHYSAGLIVDLGNTATMVTTIVANAFPTSGGANALSGAIIGDIADLHNANTFCNLLLAGNAVFTSGELRVGVQTSDGTTSGSFTDPTSGLAAASLPTSFVSGGILYLNSGGANGGLFGALVSGQSIQSGFCVAAGFQRIGRYARAVMFGSGAYAGNLTAAFVTQSKITGSGGGFAYSPSSGTVNV